MKSSWSQWAQKPSKNECFKLKFIEQLKFQNFRILFFWFFKKRRKQNKFQQEWCRPSQAKIQRNWGETIDRSIWRRCPNDHIFLITIDSGDDLRTPTTSSPSGTSRQHHYDFLIKTSDGQPRQVHYLGDVRDHPPLAPGSNIRIEGG